VRLEDRRLEVRTAAARALGDIGSNEAVPALSEASCSAALRRRTSSPTRCGGSAARTPARRSSEASQVNWPYLVALPRQGPLLLARWGLVEALWFRPCLAWWRLKATVLALSGRRPGWGTIPRGAGILERPAEVVAPLTR
jgi:hypothetical protein